MRGTAPSTRFAAVQAQFRPPESNTEAMNRARSQYGQVANTDTLDAAEVERRRQAGAKIMAEHEAELKAQGKSMGGGEIGNRLSDIDGSSPAPAPSSASS